MDRTKFNVDKDKEKRTCNNIVFDSQLEMKYYRDVILPQWRSGRIKKYELQKPYELQPEYICNGRTVRPIVYVADFYVEYDDGSVEVIDTKGFPDSVAKIKKKMFEYQYSDTVYKWVTYVKKYGGWIEYAKCDKLRKEAKRQKQLSEKESPNE